MSELTIPLGTRTLAILLMDESGSMERFGAAPIEAIEHWLTEQRSAPHAATTAVGVLTFAEELGIRIPISPVRATTDLRGYHPDGGTRLYASARDILQGLREEPRLRAALPPEVVFAVFTDGRDNRSSERSLRMLRELAAGARADAWTLLTFGFGVDARELAGTMGFPDDGVHAQTMSASRGSIHRSVAYASHITSLRASRVT